MTDARLIGRIRFFPICLIAAIAVAAPGRTMAQQQGSTGCYSGPADQAASLNPSCEGGTVAPLAAPATPPATRSTATVPADMGTSEGAAPNKATAAEPGCYSGPADQEAARNPACEGGIVAPTGR